MTETMTIKALAGWFGSNRTQAELVGQELGRLSWCGVFFAGGMSELPHIRTQAGVAIDLHHHMVNLASVVADDRLLLRMIHRVDRMLHHAESLAAAQRRCRARAPQAGGGLFGEAAKAADGPDVDWAADYFACCWMCRGGIAGQSGEFNQGLSIRWSASGGGSARRWRSAVESLPAWHAALHQWSFACMDAFDAMAKLDKQKGAAGCYFDPPWVLEGAAYAHPFTERHHRRLAAESARLSGAGYRIVLRYGDHPLIRELYPIHRWRWIESTTKDQQGGNVAEVLIVNAQPPASAGPGRTEAE